MRATVRTLAVVGTACLLVASASHAQTLPASTKAANAQTKAAKAQTKAADPIVTKNPVVLMKTSMGDVKIELFQKEAPISTENFLTYVDDGFYDGTIFHRVIPTFMIQGGGFTAEMQQKSTRGGIKNEATNGLKNDRGTLAMARIPDPHSATAQFFINVRNNPALDHKNETAAGFGYAVFGKVIEGMDVVDLIKAVKTASHGGHGDVPKEPVIIQSMSRVKD